MESLEEIIPRHKWKGRLPVKLAPAMQFMITAVVFLYTETEDCRTKDECLRVLHGLQKQYTAQGLYDIPYNFILGGDYNVYEGRGWRTSVPVPAELEESPFSTLAIARIGPRQDNHEKRLEDFEKGYYVIHFGLLKSKIHPSFELKKPNTNWNIHNKD